MVVGTPEVVEILVGAEIFDIGSERGMSKRISF